MINYDHCPYFLVLTTTNSPSHYNYTILRERMVINNNLLLLILLFKTTHAYKPIEKTTVRQYKNERYLVGRFDGRK